MLKIITAILCSVSILLGGCAIAPGYHAPELSGVEIKPITNELLAEQQPPEPAPLPSSLAASTDANLYNYRIGSHDVLKITVWDQQGFIFPAGNFSGAAQGTVTSVEADGTVFFPYVGKIKAAGKTLDELRTTLVARIKDTVINPQITITIEEFRSKKFYVFGEVAQPGKQAITNSPLTAVDAIGLAGGATDDADLVNVTLTRNDRKYRVDLLSLHQEGKIPPSLLLADGDILYVPSKDLRKVYVIGEVFNQASLPFQRHRFSLTEAISDAGGINPVNANPAQIYVIRGRPEKMEIFHLDASTPAALILGEHFYLQPRDVVYVETAGVTRWNRVISQILPSVQFLGQPDLFNQNSE
jgi:polysaccharide export outer membrane protein